MATVVTRFKVEGEQSYNASLNKAGNNLQKLQNKGQGVSGVLTRMSSSLGVNIGQLAKMGTAVGAVSAALKVGKDAFLATEQGMDAWARTTKEAESVYKGFLLSLNTGNIGGFLSNMGAIKKAAQEAYDAADNLGTMTSFSDVDLQAINTKRMNVQLALKEAKRNGASDAEVKALQDQLMGFDDQIEATAREKADLAMKAYIAELKSIVKNGDGIWNEAIARKYADTWGGYGQLNQADITKMEKAINARKKKWGSTDAYVINKTRGVDVSGDVWKEARITHEMEIELSIMQALFKQEQAVLAAKQNQVTAEQALQQAIQSRMNSERYMTVKGTGGAVAAGPVGPLTVGMPDAWAAMAAGNAKGMSKSGLTGELNQIKTVMPEFDKNSIMAWNEELKVAVDLLNRLTVGSEAYNRQMAEVTAIQSKIAGASGKETKALDEGWTSAAQAVGVMGQALQTVEDPGVKAAGIVMQAIANIAGSFAKSLNGTVSPWDWMAAAISGGATMLSLISSIKTATAGSYATGGVIGGNGLSGDNLIANVNSGELILNRAQQGNLASQLNQNGIGNMRIVGQLDGESIRLAMVNSNRRRGRSGEAVSIN